MDSNKWYRLDSIRKAKATKRKKKYKDNRNWREYNNKLPREVELILDFNPNRKVKHGRGGHSHTATPLCCLYQH